MAKGRMLNKKISTDERVARLSPLTNLLFVLCIPHLDCEGRLSANPIIVKGFVVPLREEFTVEIIRECLVELADCGLILLYGEGNKYMQFPGFPKNQTIRKEFEAASIIPAPDSLQSNYGTQAQSDHSSRAKSSDTSREQSNHSPCEQINNGASSVQSEIQSNSQRQTQSHIHMYSEAAPAGAADTQETVACVLSGKKENASHLQVDGTPAKARVPHESITNPSQKKQVSSVTADLLDCFMSAFQAARHEPYVSKSRKRDASRFDELLSQKIAPEDIKQRIGRFFVSDDKYIKSSDYALPVFITVFNKLSRNQKKKEGLLAESDRLRAERIARVAQAAKQKSGEVANV